jgi:hypothetical protein
VLKLHSTICDFPHQNHSLTHIPTKPYKNPIEIENLGIKNSRKGRRKHKVYCTSCDKNGAKLG